MTNAPKPNPLPAELFHYTNWVGLKGILESQSLYATSFDGLNDRTEVGLFRIFLKSAVAKSAKKLLLKQPRPFSQKRRIEKAGGLDHLIARDLDNLLDSSYEAAFLGNANGRPIFPPFITSFCGHAQHETYEQKNGLLSQWRGYGHGSEGRFALVFDTKGLEKRIQAESELFEYPYIRLSKVIYNDANFHFEEAFSNTIDHFTEAFISLVSAEDPHGDIPGLDPLTENLHYFIDGATRFKHPGFREEHEVRIVACPMDKEIESTIIQRSKETGEIVKPAKQVFSRMKGENTIRYIRLFADNKGTLPITRIVVGPSANQDAQAAEAKKLCANSQIKITKSETPFID